MLMMLYMPALGLFACTAAAASVGQPAPLVGAIRWDANFDAPGMPDFEDKNFGIVARATTYNLLR